MIAVFDTNIVVSGLLSPFGPPGRLLDLMQRGEIQLIYDDRILLEYQDILYRPKFNFERSAVTALLDFIAFDGRRVVAAPLALNLPDSDDAAFVEVAVAASATLVTGNLRHYPADKLAHLAVSIASPAQSLEFWQSQQG